MRSVVSLHDSFDHPPRGLVADRVGQLAAREETNNALLVVLRSQQGRGAAAAERWVGLGQSLRELGHRGGLGAAALLIKAQPLWEEPPLPESDPPPPLRPNPPSSAHVLCPQKASSSAAAFPTRSVIRVPAEERRDRESTATSTGSPSSDEEAAVASDISSSEDMAAARRWMAPGQIKINKYKRTEELGYRDCASHGPETVVVDGGKRA